jgi:two-component system, OmpR family, heavy metal sensor histidine kinase CusS
MRSIRWSLLVYFLVLLALAMGIVSVLVYQRMRETVHDKERTAEQLLVKQHETQRQDVNDKLDEKLLDRARTLISLAQFQFNTNPSHARFRTSAQAGHVIAGLGPSSSYQAASGLLQAFTAIYQSNQGPFAEALHRNFIAELQFNEDELFRDADYGNTTEYFQVDSNVGQHTGWKSRSLGERSFSVDPAVFSKIPRYRGPLGGVLAGGNANPLNVLGGVALRPDDDSSYPLLEPQTKDRVLEPGHVVRCVSLKAPVTAGSIRFAAWGGPWTPRGPRVPGEPRTDPRTPTQPDRTQYFLFVQCASDTDERDRQLGLLDKELQDDVAGLKEESQASLASLRKHLWLICATTFISAAVGGYLLVLVGLAPLKRLGEAVSRVTPKDFMLPMDNRPLPVELRPIAERLSQTLALLKRAFAREKQAAADISHDLRTPVAALLAATEVALRKTRSAQQYREVLEDCHTTGKQMSRLVERLLSLARLDAGVDHVRTSDVDVADLAQECVDLVRPLATERSLELQLQRNGSLEVHTDREKVREVLTNLLHNAIQYNRPGGSVAVNVERINGRFHVAVSDTGIGIAPEMREHIFERFFRADPSRHVDAVRVEQGGSNDNMHSGLGLAIVKGYVDLLGGSIAVESTVGKGSTFHVDLPAAPLTRRSR